MVNFPGSCSYKPSMHESFLAAAAAKNAPPQRPKNPHQSHGSEACAYLPECKTDRGSPCENNCVEIPPNKVLPCERMTPPTTLSLSTSPAKHNYRTRFLINEEVQSPLLRVVPTAAFQETPAPSDVGDPA
ncbi:hypothetical protein COCOBI_02-0970 [Coccomyxa sp. Obi]|nr:hypothetical protein COCOBI_02-0970 [Coccomyxa sp. Obi]